MTNLRILLTAAGIVIMAWVLNLVRRDRLYVGYGVLLLGSIVGTLVAVLVPQVLTVLTRILGSPSSFATFTVLALLFVLVMLVYILSQLTRIINRVTVLVQALAIQQARRGHPSASVPLQGDSSASAPSPDTSRAAE